MKNYLLTVEPWNIAGAATVTRRWARSDHETGAGDTPADAYFEGVLAGFTLSRAAVRLDGGLGGQSAPATGSATIIVPPDWKSSGELAALKGYAWDGRDFSLVELADGVTDPASGTVVATGQCSGLAQTGAAELVLAFHDRSLAFRRTMQSAFYAGSGGTEGGALLEGKPKPLTFGRVDNVPAVMCDTTNRWLDLHAGEIEEVVAVRDDGVALTASGSNPPAAGSYYVDLANGRIRLGTDPTGLITADVKGAAPSGTWADDLAAIVEHLVMTFGGLGTAELDAAAFTALATARPDVVGVHISTTEADLAAVLDRLMSPLGYWGFDRDGLFTVGVIAAPTASASTDAQIARVITADEVVEGSLSLRPLGVPAWRVGVEWRRLGTVQRFNETTTSVSLADRDDFSTDVRVGTDEDASVKTAHPQSEPITLGSPAYAQSTAETLAGEVRDLIGTYRRLATLSTDTAVEFDRGAEIWITHADYGLDGPARVLGVTETDGRRARLEVVI